MQDPAIPGPKRVPHPTPYPRCIFCGKKADSREHAIPAWMSRRLGIKAFLHTVVWENITPRKQPISFASHRARIFCAGCNHHFKHLEDAAIPLLVPMAKGRALVLGPESQQLLALWAAKTGVALIAATAVELRDFVPVEHRRTIREEELPPKDFWVGYLPWNGTLHVSAGDHAVVDHDVRPASQFQAYGAVFTFSKLAFKIVGFLDPLPDTYRIDGDRPSIKQFWPQQAQSIEWPPWGPPAGNGNMSGVIAFAPIKRVPKSR